MKTFFINTLLSNFNPSLPSAFSPASLSSDSYILPLPSAYIYCNADSNEHDPLFCPSYTVQRIHNISMVLSVAIKSILSFQYVPIYR